MGRTCVCVCVCVCACVCVRVPVRGPDGDPGVAAAPDVHEDVVSGDAEAEAARVGVSGAQELERVLCA